MANNAKPIVHWEIHNPQVIRKVYELFGIEQGFCNFHRSVKNLSNPLTTTVFRFSQILPKSMSSRSLICVCPVCNAYKIYVTGFVKFLIRLSK